ncbi:hypothetical protein [Streptosporangium sp. NBC_01469]|nr:hypothetical protein [Streptosporangium sp. NBC_01469]
MNAGVVWWTRTSTDADFTSPRSASSWTASAMAWVLRCWMR